MMSDASCMECPNCGGTEFVDIRPHKHRCAYCGTVLTTPETAPEVVKCPRCGFENERGDRFCNNCGRTLVSWVRWGEGKKADPAVISIIVTLVGSMFIPFAAAIVGLFLGYRALKDARAGDEGEKQGKLARAAVVIGWMVLASSILPLFVAVGMPALQWTCSTCNELFLELGEELLSMFGGGSG